MEKFERCLVVTRHQLLQLQERDISSICQTYTIVPEFPQNPQEQRQLVEGYNVVIGTLPINLIQSVQNLGRTYITFTMRSLGTYTAQDVNNVINRYGQDRVAVLPPSRQGEPYRLTLYQGLKAVRILVEETPITSHEFS